MSIKIGSNLASLNAQRRLGDASSSLSSIYEKLSSGQRINRASDDAAGLAIADSLNVNSRIFSQAVRNVNDTVSAVTISSRALDTMKDITIRQRELAQQSANGSYSSKQRDALDKESRELTNEYNRIIETTSFNGQKLLANPWDTLTTQLGVGSDATIGYKFADELMEKINPGDYFTVNGVSSRYYVWFAVDGQGTNPAATGSALNGMTGLKIDLYSTPNNESTSITLPTDSSGNLTTSGGTYFTINSPTNGYYVWFDSGGSVDPAPGGTGIKIDMTPMAQETTTFDLNNTSGYFSSDNGSYFTLSDNGSDYYVWFNDNGTDPAPGGTGIRIDYSRAQDSNARITTGSSYGDYFQLDSYTYYLDDGTGSYNTNYGNDVGIDISGLSGGDPSALVAAELQAHGYGATVSSAYTIDITNGSSNMNFGAFGAGPTLIYNNPYTAVSSTVDQVASDIATALNNTGYFSASNSGGQVTVTTNSYANSTDAVDGGSGTSVAVTQQGGSTTNATTVAAQIASALAATGQFSASSASATIDTTVISSGSVTDAANYSSGAFIGVTQQGGAVSLDGASIAAKVSAALNGTGNFTTQLIGSKLTITNNTAGQGGVTDVNTGIFLKDIAASTGYSSTVLTFGDARGMTQVNQLDLSTRSGALEAITTLDNRLQRLSLQQGAYGSVLSRFSVASNVLQASSENFKAAESRIRDVDIAQESSNLIRTQILQQAAASVLAQANQGPQLVLRLLQ